MLKEWRKNQGATQKSLKLEWYAQNTHWSTDEQEGF